MKFLSTFSCVSLRGMKETGVQAGRFHPATAIYAVPRSFSRPILARTYSAEVTSLLSNLPHHRIDPLTGTFVSYINTAVCVKDFLKYFSPFFSRFMPRFWAGCRPDTKSRPGAGLRGGEGGIFQAFSSRMAINSWPVMVSWS